MNSEILKTRTKAYSISMGKLILQLANNVLNRNYSNQLVGLYSAVGANYRATCRAKSTANFLQEFNLELKAEIQQIWKEGNELLSIIVSAMTTIRKNEQNRKSSI